MDRRKKRSYALSSDAVELLAALAAKLGVSMTAILELAIREKAEREGIKVENGKRVVK